MCEKKAKPNEKQSAHPLHSSRALSSTLEVLSVSANTIFLCNTSYLETLSRMTSIFNKHSAECKYFENHGKIELYWSSFFLLSIISDLPSVISVVGVADNADGIDDGDFD